ncbi:uncharacterized protein L201_000589 [Kwoniella dendrophila CBS 6074]|uniref:GATA-type domain-containing protein n=1 Tax=Kwoniella dendrophila CBS 6074 TaxID=1295534 RepID=A0AAX4JMU8_9TREE
MVRGKKTPSPSSSSRKRSSSKSSPAPYSTGRPAAALKRDIRATVCQNCGCNKSQTSMWRTNKDEQRLPADDNMLCNACGLWRIEHGVHRPPGWWSKCRSSKSRSRSPLTASSSSPNSSPPPTPAVASTRRNRSSRKRADSIKQEKVESREAALILLNMGQTKDKGESDSDISSSSSSPIVSGPSPLILRPAWVFNSKPKQVQPIPPPLGFLPIPRPRPLIAVEDLLNSPATSPQSPAKLSAHHLA